MTESKVNETQLFSAFSRLLREELIDKISVKDIVHEANISRATFYRFFYDKYGLFNAGYNRVLQRTLYQFPDRLSWKEAVAAIYREIKFDLRVYQNALRSDDVNSLKNHIFRISKDFHLAILRKSGVDIRNWKVEKAIDSYVHGNLEVMTSWILDGMKEPIEEMQDVMDTVIPSQFKRYFLS